MPKPSSGQVLRVLAEEARERGAHPDRATVLDAYLDDSEEEQTEAPAEPGKKGGK
jgi:hypothetical protein